MIPNYEMWSNINADIKGGFAFVLSCGRGGGGGGRGPTYSTLEAPVSSGQYGGI